MTSTRALLLAASAALVVSCNVYNPSGEGNPSTDGEWIDQGEAQLRDRDFDAARASFGRVLARDSGNTAAWSGYVKAVSGSTLDLGLLLREARAAELERRKPLWDIPLERKDSIYRSILPTWNAFETWARLDSVGRAWLPPVRRTERGLLLLAHSMLLLWDSNRDGRIDASGDVLSVRLFGSIAAADSSGLGFRPAATPDLFLATLPDGAPDTTGAVDSARLAEYDALLGTVDAEFATIDLIARRDTTLSAIASSISEQNPGAIGFFAVSDRDDDDMDGCADEEILDGLDNDGDGLVDEDARAGHPISGAGAGDLAQRSGSDSIRGDRLADPVTGIGLPGDDSAGTLRYADAAGRFQVFAPSWNPADPRYGAWRWKYACDWDQATAAAMGTTCFGGAPMDPAARIAIARHVAATAPGTTRAEAGCSLLGGCWCRLLETVCRTGGCDAP